MDKSFLIGLTLSNESVKYIIIHSDGHFGNIVPILRKYKKRSDIEKLMKMGNLDALCDVSELPEVVNEFDTEEPAEIAYEKYDLPRYQYIYIFNECDEWECQTSCYFRMDQLK
jgi:hypothetical protein